MKNKKTICAVIVTFHPNFKELIQLLKAVSNQVNQVVVVDNTPPPNVLSLNNLQIPDNVHLVTLGDNYGIAYALNKGIAWSESMGANYVLLLDQDSVPNEQMVDKLLANFSKPSAINRLAAVGPATFDERTNRISYFIVSRLGLPFRFNPKNHPTDKVIKVGFLISSGSLICINALKDIGGMRDNYFIDHVDTEWCFRARSKGYDLVGDHDAILNHCLGDKVDKVWIGYVRHVAHHSALRDYYMFRNTVLMLRDVKIPVFWRVFLILRLFQFTIYFLLFAENRIPRCKLMSMGLVHGIKGISGKLDLETMKCSEMPTVLTISP